MSLGDRSRIGCVLVSACLAAGLTAACSQPPPPPGATAEVVAGPSEPGAVSPPRAGEYTYTFENSTGDDGAARSTYGSPQTKRDVTAQTLDVVGGGRNEKTSLEWRPDGLYNITTVFTLPSGTVDCTWSPPLLERRLPMSVGTTWTSESTCPVVVDDAKAQMRRSVQGTVVEATNIKMGQETVAVWAYDWSDRLESPRGVQEQVGRMYFSPKHGLFVRATGKMTQTPTGGATTTTDFTRQLARLDPAT